MRRTLRAAQRFVCPAVELLALLIMERTASKKLVKIGHSLNPRTAPLLRIALVRSMLLDLLELWLRCQGQAASRKPRGRLVMTLLRQLLSHTRAVLNGLYQFAELPSQIWNTVLFHTDQLFGSFTPVRGVLHGLRRSRLVDRRLGGQTTRSRGICHLLGEYSVAWPIRPQRRPVCRRGQQRFVLDDDLVD